MTLLRLAPELALPPEAVTETFGILAAPGRTARLAQPQLSEPLLMRYRGTAGSSWTSRFLRAIAPGRKREVGPVGGAE
jgi:hypothetical protein